MEILYCSLCVSRSAGALAFWHTIKSYKGPWSFIGLGPKKRYPMKEDSPQEIWDKLAEKMLLEVAESGCPICRAYDSSVQEVISKVKDVVNCRFILRPFRKQLRLFIA